MSVEHTLAGHIVAIDHVGIAVPDLDEALDFYVRQLGFRVSHREFNDEQLVEEAMLTIGESEVTLQLIAPTQPDSAIAKFLDKRGPGLQQLAYEVHDIDAACAAADAAGLRLIYDAPRRGTQGSRINFIHPASAGGVLIELVQPPRT